jgi:predicted Zn-dependent protease
MNAPQHLLSILLVVMMEAIQAKPFIPEHDTQVLERLPGQLFQSKSNAKIKQLRTQIRNHPNDWSSASQLAQHYIELAKSQADPRYMGYAQAILNPWWQNSQQSPKTLIMRAIIRQNAHDFGGALEDLDQILNVQPGHVQANLIKATIATVQGNYPLAIEHCRQLMRRSSMLLALVCQSTPASLSGNAETSYKLVRQILSTTGSIPEKESVWAWTSLAEIAWRLGYFEAADQHFQTAMQTGIKDFYLFRVYADFLLQQHRPHDVIKLIASETRIDSLLLRLALAEQMTLSEQLSNHIALLNERFEANRKRGSSLHKGDEARFKLHLLNQPQTALQLARQNWQVQRESADTYILLQSAIAANDTKMIKKVEHWLIKQGTEDVLIKQILATKRGQSYEL